jgi:OTU domain-containing protein 6
MDPENTTAPSVIVETLEELRTRHKKEQKDLMAKVTGLKKTATKGDKKKKKEVLIEIAQLEQALSLQQDQEEKALLANGAVEASSSSSTTTATGVEQEEEEEDDFDPNDVSLSTILLFSN